MKLNFFATPIAVVTLVAACSSGEVSSETEARETANMFITEKYNVGDLADFAITSRETPISWTFTYDIVDENWTGGPLFVTIDKKDGRVAGHGGAQ